MDNNNVQFDPMTGQQIRPHQQSILNQKKINIKLVVIIAIVVIIACIIFIPKLFDNKEKSNVLESLTESTSFWMKNKENMYAMFDIDGKQLTDFGYTSVSSSFLNGTAIVENQNDEYGLISSTGKMIIDFGKYNYIFRRDAVYEMIDEDFNSFLYGSSGNLVRQLDKDEDIESFVCEYTYALIKSETDYKVIDYNGKEITTIAIPEEDDVNDPEANSNENYVSIFYNDVSYIIDVSKGKVLLTISDSRHFCIGGVNEENSDEFILYNCSFSYGEETDYGFKLIRNGKIAYSKEPDNYASMKFEGNNVIYDSNGTYLLDENGNEQVKVGYIIYKDYNNYISQVDGVQNGAELYVDGTLKEKINCNTIQGGYAKYGVYLLDHCSGYGSGNKIYMNYDGTLINNKSYQRAYEFDENGYASVSEDTENFYLINLKGEKVSDYYSNDGSAEKIYYIDETDNLYRGSNEDGTMTIFKVNGEKILTGNINFSLTSIAADGVFVILEEDNKYTVYDITNGEAIVTLNSKPDMLAYYFTTSENSKTQYYSYTTGKLFYEE